MKLEHDVFTVSLDFELYWGVRDKRTLAECKDRLQGGRNVLPGMLRAFQQHNVHATWATVGFLFLKDFDELNNHIPQLAPAYVRETLSPYKYIAEASDLEAAYHFAPELIDLIIEHDGQEIGTHTFSHFYCLEEGQTLAQFKVDILSAVAIAKRRGLSIRSLVFPRNQWNPEYLPALDGLGVRCFRGNPASWMYDASDDEIQTSNIRRAARLLDAYLNLSGHHTYSLEDCVREKPFNLPASRFLRPYSNMLGALEGLRLRRITSAMDHAAKNNKIFHLWWHPHNFGAYTRQNMEFLRKLLEHYTSLERKYGMKSLNMGELALLGGGADEH